MPKFGRNPFPFKFGGGASEYEQEHLALLDALAPGWDKSADTESYVELLGYALAVSMIWKINQRVRNQMLPAKMLENVTVWEEVLRLSPTKSDTTIARRAAIAAKLRGLAGNALKDLQAVCSTIAGANYVAITSPDAAHSWAYWPGVNPGPPGAEWSSNRATVSVVVARGTLSEADLFAMLEKLTTTLNAMIPSWMNFNIGTDDGGFVCSVGVCGVTLMAA